jgi:putative ABC transport system permease protein
MLKNYLIVALRNIIRQKGYSLINIIGLSTGLAATILLLVYIQHECSYDTMYKNNHLIYRVNTEAQISSGEKIHIPMTSAFLAPELEKNVPEVKHICRLREHSFNFLYNSQSYKINSVLDSDSSFFKIFSIKIIQGDRNKLFNDRYSIILSKKQATKIFGKENPIGKILHSKNLQYTVSGVFEDIPANSHIQFDALRSFDRFKNKEREFGNNGISFYTYLLFQKDCDIEVAKKKVIKIARERFDENAKSQGIEIKTDLQQLLDIHLADEIELI